MELTAELTNKVTWRIPNALALVGSRHGTEWNAMTTSWITQVAQEPVLVGVGVDKLAVTHRLIDQGESFTVNLWNAENTRPFVKFSKPAQMAGDALNGWRVTTAETGAPVFVDAVAWMDCRVTQRIDCGSHTFFIGELVAAGNPEPDSRVASMSDARMKYGGTRRGH